MTIYYATQHNVTSIIAWVFIALIPSDRTLSTLQSTLPIGSRPRILFDRITFAANYLLFTCLHDIWSKKCRHYNFLSASWRNDFSWNMSLKKGFPPHFSEQRPICVQTCSVVDSSRWLGLESPIFVTCDLTWTKMTWDLTWVNLTWRHCKSSCILCCFKFIIFVVNPATAAKYICDPLHRNETCPRTEVSV